MPATKRQPDGDGRCRAAEKVSEGMSFEPRFEALPEGDVHFKLPGEVVTIAGEEAECDSRAGWATCSPDAAFVGRASSGGSGLAEATAR